MSTTKARQQRAEALLPAMTLEKKAGQLSPSRWTDMPR